MHKVTPFLWFDIPLEGVVEFYASVFPNARIDSVTPTSASFVLEGQHFMALNGGPMYRFTEAISFFVSCETQEEIDYYWSRLSGDGGAEGRCGWLKDRFGLSWQIVPSALGRYLSDSDRQRAERVMRAMLEMEKLNIAALDMAFAGG